VLQKNRIAPGVARKRAVMVVILAASSITTTTSLDVINADMSRRLDIIVARRVVVANSLTVLSVDHRRTNILQEKTLGGLWGISPILLEKEFFARAIQKIESTEKEVFGSVCMSHTDPFCIPLLACTNKFEGILWKIPDHLPLQIPLQMLGTNLKG